MALHVGFGNYVIADKITALLDARAPKIRKLKHDVEQTGKLVDCTRGRKAWALVCTEEGVYYLSAIPMIKLMKRIGIVPTEDPITPKEIRAGVKIKKRQTKQTRLALQVLSEHAETHDVGDEVGPEDLPPD